MPTLLLGCGGVGSCTLAMLPNMAGFDMKTLTIIDQAEHLAELPVVRKACELGAKFVCASLTRENWDTLLSTHLGAGDTILDLTFGINCIDILSWCQEHGVRYLNTAVEKWEDELIPDNHAQWMGDGKEKGDWTVNHKDLYDRTLYARHLEITTNGFASDGPTAVLEHGCNPGLVSHFVRAALDNISEKVIEAVPSQSEELRGWLAAGDYPRVASALGLRVVHISEIDTQTSTKIKPNGSFVNTWSPMGFAEEALDWVQVGWGTHERPLPKMLVPSQGSQNQVFVPMHAMDLVMDSYVPNTPIKGMCIPHGEADTITEALTLYDEDDDSSDSGDDSDADSTSLTSQGQKKRAKKAVYRPSVYYVYQCADIALASLEEMKKNGYIPQSKYHVMLPMEDGLKGEDRVGVLLMFEDDPIRVVKGEVNDDSKPWSYWYGSILSDTDNPVHGFGPTVVQVAASVLGAYKWMQENPNEGVCWPDKLPHKYILDFANPFLGTIVSEEMKEFVPPKSLQFADFICSPG